MSPARLVSTSLDEAALQSLIHTYNPHASQTVRAQAQAIRDVFVNGLGWDASELAQYRFRDLALLAQPGEIVSARVRGGQDVVALGGAPIALKAMAGMTNSQARAYAAERLGVGEAVEGLLRERTVMLTDAEWKRLDRLVARANGALPPRRKESRHHFGTAILKLLEQAYGRG